MPDPLTPATRVFVAATILHTYDDGSYALTLPGDYEIRAAAKDIRTAASLPGFREGVEAAADAARRQRNRLSADGPLCACGNGRVPVTAYGHAIDACVDAIRSLVPPPSTREERLAEALQKAVTAMLDHNSSALTSAIAASNRGSEPHDCGIDFADVIREAEDALK